MNIINGCALRDGLKPMRPEASELWIVDAWIDFRHDPLPRKIQNSPVETVITDTLWAIKDYKFNNMIVYTGAYFYRQLESYKLIQARLPNEISTNRNFCFSSNKNLFTRLLTVKLIEYFQLSNFSYTFNGQNGQLKQDEIDYLGLNSLAMDNSLRDFIKNPVQLSNNLIYNQLEQREVSNEMQLLNVHSTNLIENLLPIFKTSAVHLITEPSMVEWCVYTEKTLNAVLSLNIPIWIGGYKMVENFRNIGFDVFDDIIDNSYDTYDNMFDRCYYAFEKNKRLLTDIEYATQLRHNIKDRLIANKDFALSDKIHQDFQDRINSFACSERAKKYCRRFVYG